MDLTYPIILLVVLIISPIVFKLANKQDNKTKRNLKIGFLLLLVLELISGFFDWETFSGTGRGGFSLALTYPTSFLGLFFVIILAQIPLLFVSNRITNNVVVALNFVNTVVFFLGLILVSRIIGNQVVSLWSIGAIFAVLIGNVVGLVWLNKDKISI